MQVDTKLYWPKFAYFVNNYRMLIWTIVLMTMMDRMRFGEYEQHMANKGYNYLMSIAQTVNDETAITRNRLIQQFTFSKYITTLLSRRLKGL